MEFETLTYCLYCEISFVDKDEMTNPVFHICNFQYQKCILIKEKTDGTGTVTFFTLAQALKSYPSHSGIP